VRACACRFYTLLDINIVFVLFWLRDVGDGVARSALESWQSIAGAHARVSTAVTALTFTHSCHIDLKKSLYELFSPFGAVLEIVASSGIRYRGQAWVVFRDLESANNAKREMQDHIMFDKAIQIEYAKVSE
jgi:hypothetical protein